MKYAMMVWHGDDHWEPEEEISTWPEHKAWIEELRARGVHLGGERLRPDALTMVRVRNGETLVSDGPFAETKDLIGGFFVIECEDLDEAIRVAAGHPFAKWGTVEVRRVWE